MKITEAGLKVVGQTCTASRRCDDKSSVSGLLCHCWPRGLYKPSDSLSVVPPEDYVFTTFLLFQLSERVEDNADDGQRQHISRSES